MVPLEEVPFSLETLLGARAKELTAPNLIEDPVIVDGDILRFSFFNLIPALRSAVSVMSAWDGTLKTARAWSPSGGASYELFPTREQLTPLYDAGCTIVLENVERFIPELRPYCRALERDLGVAVGKVNVEVFCARGVGRGRAHFDSSFTFNCQIEGQKIWRLGRHDAVRFPTSGMFLGRVPEEKLARTLTGQLPSSLENYETVIASPGTVVFLPPGVLHQTDAETGTYAIAFAIEETDTLATAIADKVLATLQAIPELRAARLGSQSRNLGAELGTAAAILRSVADRIEMCGLENHEPSFELRRNLRVQRRGPNCVILHGDKTSREFTLDHLQAEILSWASARGAAFTLSSLGQDLSGLDIDDTEKCLQHLVHLGLLERFKA